MEVLLLEGDFQASAASLAVPGAVANVMTSYKNHAHGASLAEPGPGAADVLSSCGLSWWWRLATVPLLRASVSHILAWGPHLGTSVPWHFQPAPWWPRASSQAEGLRCDFSRRHLAFNGLVTIKAMCVGTS